MTPTTAPDPRMTRRGLLRAGAAAGGAAAIGGGAYAVSRLLARGSLPFLASWRVTEGTHGSVRRFYSAPELEPPTMYVLARDSSAAERSYLFMGPAGVGGAQAGPMIVDLAGEPVWFRRAEEGSWLTNFGVHTYRDAPVLVWWEGRVVTGYGFGEAIIVDRSYREIARVRAANGRHVDLHELTLTDQGTALFTCPPVTAPADLRAIGGSRRGSVRESIFQEVDVATGRLIREWRSLGHVDPAESYRPPTDNFDYMHLNSIDVTPDGNLLVSGRHTWALYKLDRATGAVMWRLGGRRTQFAIGPSADFAWQHDVRLLQDQTLTVFDNGDDGRTKTHRTRGLQLRLDEPARRLALSRAYVRSRPGDATAMGSVRRLDDGHVAIGWGSVPYATEFDAGGNVLADLRIGTSTDQKSYRSFRQGWSGRPATHPAVAVRRDRSSGRATAYVSWNGATEVTHWRIDAGARPADLRTVGAAPRRGFETAINLGTGDGHIAVTGLDARGRALGSSAAIAV